MKCTKDVILNWLQCKDNIIGKITEYNEEKYVKIHCFHQQLKNFKKKIIREMFAIK